MFEISSIGLNSFQVKLKNQTGLIQSVSLYGLISAVRLPFSENFGSLWFGFFHKKLSENLVDRNP